LGGGGLRFPRQLEKGVLSKSIALLLSKMEKNKVRVGKKKIPKLEYAGDLRL